MVARLKGFLQIVHEDMFITVRTFGRKKRLEMPNFAAISVDEYPFWQDIGLWIMFLDIHARLEEVVEEGIKPMERKFAN